MGVPAVIFRGSGTAYCIPDTLRLRNATFESSTNQMIFGPATGFRSTVSVAVPAANRTLTIPDPGANASFVMTAGTQTVNGFKTFGSVISCVSQGIIFGATVVQTTLICESPASPRTFTLKDFASGDILVTTGTYTISGTYTFSNTIVGSVSGSSGSVTNGAYINVSNNFTLTQNILAATNQIVLGATNTTTINSVAPAASRVYTIIDAGAAAEFVMTQGTLQTLAGTYRYSNGVGITATTNQLTLGTTNTVIITSPAPAVSRVYTLPDAGAAANFILSQAIAAQTIASTTTFTINAGTTFALNVAAASTPVAALAFAATGAATIGPTTGSAGIQHLAYGRSINVQNQNAVSSAIQLLAPTGGSGSPKDWLMESVGSGRGTSTAGNWILRNGTDGVTAIEATSAGALTLGPTTGTIGGITHNTYSGEMRDRYYSGSTFIGETRSTANSTTLVTSTLSAISTASAYFGLSQSGVADRWYIGFDTGSSDLNFRPSSTATAATLIATAGGNWTFTTGNVLIGATGTGARKFDVRQDPGAVGTGVMSVDILANAISGQKIVQFTRGGLSAELGSISRVTLTDAVAYNATSDERLKEDFQDFDGLGLTEAIEVFDFAWKASGERHYGYKAQQVYKHLPFGVVSPGVGEERWQMEKAAIVPILHKAIQQLTAKVKALELKAS